MIAEHPPRLSGRAAYLAAHLVDEVTARFVGFDFKWLMVAVGETHVSALDDPARSLLGYKIGVVSPHAWEGPYWLRTGFRYDLAELDEAACVAHLVLGTGGVSLSCESPRDSEIAARVADLMEYPDTIEAFASRDFGWLFQGSRGGSVGRVSSPGFVGTRPQAERIARLAAESFGRLVIDGSGEKIYTPKISVVG